MTKHPSIHKAEMRKQASEENDARIHKEWKDLISKTNHIPKSLLPYIEKPRKRGIFFFRKPHCPVHPDVRLKKELALGPAWGSSGAHYYEIYHGCCDYVWYTKEYNYYSSAKFDYEEMFHPDDRPGEEEALIAAAIDRELN